ncbi:ubiquitin carboxyl-terminal hydrolase-like [Gigantopelta aegis]|uniref:ubiquitin carboxyl-terminal hydrolase-like n=1 Tax=Gigantopelta aegis TaxID=1735272 RepID=UPI001B88C534|nr:ubiquitin carboxyl-terminal hydrolase-like [Gigantopelta aegis]
MAEQRWVPLESNPVVLTKYIHNLGSPDDWQFVDVYGLEDDLLMMVPRPVAALMLLYPCTKKVEDNPIGTVSPDLTDSVYFIKQSIRNACGTIAIVHALANNANSIKFDADKYFSKFIEETKNMSPSERAQFLEKDKNMGNIHEESAMEGQTRAPSSEESVNPHFVAFINKNGKLFEMDGRKDGPIDHGKTTPDTFLSDAAKVVQQFMKRDPDELNFNVMALVKTKD